MIRVGDQAWVKLIARSDDFGTATATLLHLVTSTAPNADYHSSVGLDGFQGQSLTANPELQNATRSARRKRKPAVTAVIHLQLQPSELHSSCLALVLSISFSFHLSGHLMLSGLMPRKFSWDL